jgi:hypothetical protein
MIDDLHSYPADMVGMSIENEENYQYETVVMRCRPSHGCLDNVVMAVLVKYMSWENVAIEEKNVSDLGGSSLQVLLDAQNLAYMEVH